MPEADGQDGQDLHVSKRDDKTRSCEHRFYISLAYLLYKPTESSTSLKTLALILESKNLDSKQFNCKPLTKEDKTVKTFF